MSVYVKGLLQNELKNNFAEVSDFLVIDLRGVSGNDNNEIRGDLKTRGIHLRVVKNAMMRRAMDKLDMSAASALFLADPSVIAYGGDSIVDIAKDVVAWSKKVKALGLKGAFVEGTVMDSDGVKELSKMPNRAQLQGLVVVLANSPGANVAGAVAGPGGVIAGCIKTLVEKLEEAA